jgi:hypothetical protein
MMFPKKIRLVDPAAIAVVRSTICTKCGRPAEGQPHHIIKVGNGGPDHVYNLIQLCHWDCHVPAHDLNPPEDLKADNFFRLVALREGVDLKTVVDTVMELKR